MAITIGPKLGKLINADIGEAYTDEFRPFLRAFDQLVMGAVLDNALNIPPTIPSNGDAYIVATGGSGAWLDQDGKLAVYTIEITGSDSNTKTPGWEFYQPKEGWMLWVASIHQQLRYTSNAWTSQQQGFAENIVPTGVINGTNRVFTLPQAPNPSSSFRLYSGGQRFHLGDDFTLAGNVFTYNVAPPVNTNHICDYRY